MQAASVLKPNALSLQFLPSADVYCTRHCSHLLSLTCVYTSMQAKCHKTFQCDVDGTRQSILLLFFDFFL